TAWAGAGSGCSTGEPKPGWQADPSCSGRTVADVSAVGDPSTGVAVYRGGWDIVGGTSVSSPIIASVFALAGTPTASTYPGSYLYAQSSQLNDVTSGSNGSCGGSYLCTAGTGYDGPTGLGTPNGLNAFISPLVPGAPTTVTGAAGDTTVAVSWHAAAAHGHPITGYAATATPGGATCTTSGTLSCTVSGLANGTSYTFRVTATNSVGTGPASSASAGVIPATVPSQPTGVMAAPIDGGAVVSWTAPASTGGRPITGYTATSSPLGRTCTSSGALTCTILGLTNGTAYTITVTATNPMGTGPASDPSASVTPITVAGATYFSVTPNRLVDSRRAVGLPSALSANVASTFVVTDRSLNPALNIPSDAIAVTGNLTVTGQTAPGYLSLTTVATNTPGTSTLNFPLGDNRANGVTVPLGTNGSEGTLSVTYVGKAGSSADVVFDVTGYFVVPTPG
ncbi:MAG TPA: fibronectin type III domain-containing protein, partial [Candidatus Limnocylindrales bacterium]|nr:fibronectin type III domain-containing protein [Candidatus Limnocylindrales bacterium]